MEIRGGDRQSKKTKTIPIEFLDADKGCLKRELKILELKIAELDEKAPGTPRHLRLLQLYLKLDEDIKQTTEAGFSMSLKEIQTLQDNNELIQEHIKVLERNNLLVYKLRIKELEVINQSLRLRLARAEKIPRAMVRSEERRVGKECRL